MNFLEEKILADGVVKPGNILKVDSFMNHQVFLSKCNPDRIFAATYLIECACKVKYKYMDECLAYAIKYAKEHKSGSILVCLSGRGDKDIDYVYEVSEEKPRYCIVVKLFED